MFFHDRALIDGPARITREGHLVASARVSKANNIQDYAPAEVGMAPKADGSPYRIFRPEAEVFARDAVASAAHRPVTIGHPRNDVSAANWRELAVGDTGAEPLRDGDFLRIPVMVMDAKAVNAARSTHQEFSLGYTADLDMTPGTFGDAAYDGSLRNIRVNHLALCSVARGGPELRIVDERPLPPENVMKIKIGDAEVDLTDGAAVAVAIGSLTTKLSDAATRATTAETQVATLTAEKTALEQQVRDAAMTPEKLRDAARSYATTVGKAKSLGITVADSMDEPAIMKAAVSAKMGDAATGWTDAQIAAAFGVLTKDAKVNDAVDPVRGVIRDGAVASFSDARTARDQAVAAAADKRRNAWKGSN